MKKTHSIIIVVFLLFNTVLAQNSKFAIHVFNPLALFQKAGLKLEYRTNKIGFLVSGIQYYGNWPRYPGTQAAFETRFYKDAVANKEDYLFGKIIGGFQQAVDASGDGFLRRQEVEAGNYYGLGMGVGRRLNFNHFFFDMHGGLKYTLSDVKQQNAFYITGPGSILDVHFMIGLQF
jgi:hypothetical protein